MYFLSQVQHIHSVLHIFLLTLPSLSLSPAQSPSFTHGSALRDTLVFVGDTVTLPCTATGHPAPTFFWTRGATDSPVDLANERISISAETNDGTLTITNAKDVDSSFYKCTATNSVGSRRTGAVFLKVIGEKIWEDI